MYGYPIFGLRFLDGHWSVKDHWGYEIISRYVLGTNANDKLVHGKSGTWAWAQYGAKTYLRTRTRVEGFNVHLVALRSQIGPNPNWLMKIHPAVFMFTVCWQVNSLTSRELTEM